jgi:hypothetical protein
MYHRRYTNGLDTKQVKELTCGWQHARRIDLPLNVIITIRPFANLDPAQACKLSPAVRNKLGVFARHEEDLVQEYG